jgi:acyl-CoA dehydrogenase
MSWDFETEPEFEAKLAWMRDFVREQVFPLETLDLDWDAYRQAIRPLQEQVKAEGLWAAHLDPELGGQGFGQVKLALMHEILGGSLLAPPVFGSQAPDSGNSELLAIAATEDQKERWMKPLLAGEICSAFSMTEQGTGSDPKQFRTEARREGDEYVINGRKWFVDQARRGAFHILMARTDSSEGADPYRTTSMIIVPSDTPGITVRDLGTMHAPAGDPLIHPLHEVIYEDVRVPVTSLLGEEGGGFVLAQRRLGPGRIHHCMRWLGVSRRAFDAMCERAVSISVHGGLLSEKQTIQNWIADSAAAMGAARLLTLQAAWKIDREGAPAARNEIAMIKYHGAAVMHDVLDRAIQIHGALGYSTDMPLELMYRWARAGRIYDGPDEVHRASVARRILREYEPREVPSEHVPTRRADYLARQQAAPAGG